MALKAQALRLNGLNAGINPEGMIGMTDLERNLESLPEQVKYKLWKRVDDNGKTRMKVVEEEKEKDAFKKDLLTQLNRFAAHVSRVKEQYSQARNLKENLKDDEMFLHMDFAENFSCRSLNEIQTAYWNQSMVTLHPIVAYFRDGRELKHQSFVVVSNELTHSSSTVCAFLDQVIPIVKRLKSNLKSIHYWTDSPSSQYRNRFIFSVIANHQSLYNVAARWNYFEAGHGKGPCDGLGGTVKRMADEAIRQGNATIQDAKEFFDWAKKSSMKNVEFVFVDKHDTQTKQESLCEMKTKALKGTMQIHAVGMTEDPCTIKHRKTSCYCPVCMTGQYCSSWESFVIGDCQALNKNNENQEIPKEDQPLLPKQVVNTNPNETSEANESSNDRTTDDEPIDQFKPDISDMVAAIYDKEWYIGEVVDLDEESKEVEVKFMAKAKSMYKWPQPEDRIWVKDKDILCGVKSLIPSGKSQRLYKMSSDEENMIEAHFASKE